MPRASSLPCRAPRLLLLSALAVGCTAGDDGDGGIFDPTPGTSTSPTTNGDNSDSPDSTADDGSGDDGSTSSDPPTDIPVAPNGYYVEGNQIFDSSGTPHVFRGVARPSLEWSNMGEGLNPQDYEFMASWGSNVVRIALNQGFWLAGSVAYSPDYAARIDQQIEWSQAAGMDVILDLHWSDRGDFGTTPAQQRMADNNSVAFWTEVADRYKDNGRVIFELYNEPHDVTWQVWRNGGDSGDGFTAIGMQTLYDTVRATGAHNLVIVGGLDYAYDLKGVQTEALDGYNITYATHPYDFPNKAPEFWDADWGFLADTYPIVVTEFGSFECGAGYASALLSYAEQRNLSWTAWAWYPGGCDFPALITDWAGTPSQVGQAVRTALMGG